MRKKSEQTELKAVNGSLSSYVYYYKDRTASPISLLNKWADKKPKLYKKHESLVIKYAPELLIYINQQLHKYYQVPERTK